MTQNKNKNFYNHWEQQQSVHDPHSISVFHRYFIINEPDLSICVKYGKILIVKVKNTILSIFMSCDK